MISRETETSRALGRVVVALAAAMWIAVGFGAALPETTLLADLPAGELDALRAADALPDDPRELLERVFLLEPAYRFDAGLVVADTDRRWFRTVTTDAAESPVLELRRWPGDTVLAIYALKGAWNDEARGVPPVPEATFDPPVERGRRRVWVGSLDTEAGRRPVSWHEWPVEGAAGRLGALLVPGDAGLGPEAVATLQTELRAVLDRVAVRPEAWTGFEPAITERIAVPSLGLPPGEADEGRDPWQIALGADFTLGLPPGIHSRRVGEGLRGPSDVPGAVLWMRGRFVDSDGTRVVVGDARRGAYVAEVEADDAAWRGGTTPPRGAPGAEPLAGAGFEMAVERTRALAARAERWREPGFAGEWLVFRLVLPGRDVELGFPVLEGRRSESLFRIPLSWRGAGETPAPPPVDPAERFGIRFDRLRPADRKRNPWIEGYLYVPGLRLELPRGWSPVARLRSADGFPVVLVDAETTPVASLTRREPGEPGLAEAEGSGWKEIGRAGRFHAETAFDRPDGGRVFVAAEGHAFVIEPVGESPPPPEVWDRLLDSAYLLRTD